MCLYLTSDKITYAVVNDYQTILHLLSFTETSQNSQFTPKFSAVVCQLTLSIKHSNVDD